MASKGGGEEVRNGEAEGGAAERRVELDERDVTSEVNGQVRMRSWCEWGGVNGEEEV